MHIKEEYELSVNFYGCSKNQKHFFRTSTEQEHLPVVSVLSCCLFISEKIQTLVSLLLSKHYDQQNRIK